ncbi:hypothetical protein [Psychroflexus halocasei]|uniref:Uncharacterized protein n=1 Tax=Psychroflexus halocasei TaxID=908615 RepID=A0A1H4A118_9FLAO|nr:hypothetical protein [Psychroflexus halocasei]SEA29729.1 hypothetical protein SAMN05421540_104280 [Psychroflexus halocasei]
MTRDKNKYRNKTGFKTPEDYFKNFEVDSLKALKDNQSMKTPDTYFENFKVDIPQEKSRVIQLKHFYYAASAIAAILILAFVLNPLFKNQLNQDELKFSSIEQDELENYIENEIENPLDYIDQNLKFDFNKEFENSQIGSQKIIYYIGDDIYDQDYLDF